MVIDVAKASYSGMITDYSMVTYVCEVPNLCVFPKFDLFAYVI